MNSVDIKKLFSFKDKEKYNFLYSYSLLHENILRDENQENDDDEIFYDEINNNELILSIGILGDLLNEYPLKKFKLTKSNDFKINEYKITMNISSLDSIPSHFNIDKKSLMISTLKEQLLSILNDELKIFNNILFFHRLGKLEIKNNHWFLKSYYGIVDKKEVRKEKINRLKK